MLCLVRHHFNMKSAYLLAITSPPCKSYKQERGHDTATSVFKNPCKYIPLPQNLGPVFSSHLFTGLFSGSSSRILHKAAFLGFGVSSFRRHEFLPMIYCLNDYNDCRTLNYILETEVLRRALSISWSTSLLGDKSQVANFVLPK